MTRYLTNWILLLITVQEVAGCFDDDGNFFCSQKWYFWIALFAGFLVLFVIIVCVYNCCCKKTPGGLATPRVLSAMERHKNRRSVRPISNTSTWYPETSGRQIQVVSQAWQQPAVANQPATVYPNSTSVVVNQSYF